MNNFEYYSDDGKINKDRNPNDVFSSKNKQRKQSLNLNKVSRLPNPFSPISSIDTSKVSYQSNITAVLPNIFQFNDRSKIILDDTEDELTINQEQCSQIKIENKNKQNNFEKFASKINKQKQILRVHKQCQYQDLNSIIQSQASQKNINKERKGKIHVTINRTPQKKNKQSVNNHFILQESNIQKNISQKQSDKSLKQIKIQKKQKDNIEFQQIEDMDDSKISINNVSHKNKLQTQSINHQIKNLNKTAANSLTEVFEIKKEHINFSPILIQGQQQQNTNNSINLLQKNLQKDKLGGKKRRNKIFTEKRMLKNESTPNQRKIDKQFMQHSSPLRNQTYLNQANMKALTVLDKIIDNISVASPYNFNIQNIQENHQMKQIVQKLQNKLNKMVRITKLSDLANDKFKLNLNEHKIQIAEVNIRLKKMKQMYKEQKKNGNSLFNYEQKVFNQTKRIEGIQTLIEEFILLENKLNFLGQNIKGVMILIQRNELKSIYNILKTIKDMIKELSFKRQVYGNKCQLELMFKQYLRLEIKMLEEVEIQIREKINN